MPYQKSKGSGDAQHDRIPYKPDDDFIERLEDNEIKAVSVAIRG